MNPHNISVGQKVRYMSTKGPIDGEVVELFGDMAGIVAHVKWGERHLALCRYSEDKEQNTFHLAEGDEPPEAAAVTKSAGPKPFTPGARAQPEKPKQQAPKAP